MRVIAGACRGRLLRAPAGSVTRPTADRVREAIFDVLGTLADLEGTSVLDLFAGSGAMGVEALSRGAGRAVFVDRDPRAIAAVRANLASLGLADRAVVVRAEAVRWLSGHQRSGAWPAAERPGFDVALCDPPYAFDAWSDLLSRLDARLAVLESSRPLAVPGWWQVVRTKRYGGTLVTVARSSIAGPDAGSSTHDGTPELKSDEKHDQKHDKKGTS